MPDDPEDHAHGAERSEPPISEDARSSRPPVSPAPATTAGSSPPAPPTGHEDREGREARRLKGVIPELIKRAVEIGVEKAVEAPEALKHLVSDLRLPKEVATYLLSQVEETKNGALRVVAKETRDFLEHTNIANELQKMLTTLQFEINTTIRFRPAQPKSSDESGDDDDDSGPLPKPEVKMDMFARRHDKKKRSTSKPT